MNRNLHLMQLFIIGRNSMFLLPVLVIYYQEQLGLSFQQTILGEVVFSAAVLLMEIPSGWISDIWKRKHALILGMVLSIIGWAMMLFQGGFLLMAAAQCVLGVGLSFISGTDSAIIFESLAAEGREAEFRPLLGRLGAYAFYTLAIASLAGGVLYVIHPALPLYATLVTHIGALIAALLLHEPARIRKTVEKNPLHDMAVTIHEAIIKRRDLGVLMIGAALLFGSTQYVVWAQQAYWKALAIPADINGVLAAAAWGLAGIAGHIGHHIERKLGYKLAFAGIWFALCLAWVVAGTHLGWAGIGGLFLGSMAWAIGWPALQDAINQRVGSERRATIISTASLLIKAAFLPIASLASWVAEQHGVQTSLLVLAAFHIGLGCLALVVFKLMRA